MRTTTDGRDDGELVRLLLKAASVLRGELERTVAAQGLAAEQWVLLDAVGRGQGPTQGELATATGKDRSTITRGVDVLVKRGLVERRADERDGRRTRAHLTREGHALWQELGAQVDRKIATCAGDLRDEEAKTTRRALQRMGEAFEWY